MTRLLVVALVFLAFASSAALARPVEAEAAQGSGLCTICNFLVNYIEKALASNSTEQAIIAKLDKVCNYFGPFESQCQSFVAQEAPALIQLLLNKMPPAVVCAKVHACKNSTDVAEKIAKFIEQSEKSPQDASCGLCELVVSSVEQWLASNQTQAQIEQNLENVCNALPGGVSTLCDNFVEQYLPLAIQWILNNEPAQTFCTQLGLCSSKRVSLIRVLPKPAQHIPVPKDGSLCGICQLTIASVEQWLQQNSSVSEVEQYLDQVCSLFPSSISALCDGFVASYYPQAVQWILNNEPPQTFCTQIGVCSSLKPTPLRKLPLRRNNSH
eukprot:TRINITY_DN1435_c1_g1_i1.p1 TRINITY_DN1435_c1_g1~~TRINITY_DN1435_c1_g1_i1.p1  ORF type:complete len:326 (-),score=77.58 TRINITY_DN1435_c1_g1_i1:48-1025(-)